MEMRAREKKNHLVNYYGTWESVSDIYRITGNNQVWWLAGLVAVSASALRKIICLLIKGSDHTAYWYADRISGVLSIKPLCFKTWQMPWGVRGCELRQDLMARHRSSIGLVNPTMVLHDWLWLTWLISFLPYLEPCQRIGSRGLDKRSPLSFHWQSRDHLGFCDFMK